MIRNLFNFLFLLVLMASLSWIYVKCFLQTKKPLIFLLCGWLHILLNRAELLLEENSIAFPPPNYLPAVLLPPSLWLQVRRCPPLPKAKSSAWALIPPFPAFSESWASNFSYSFSCIVLPLLESLHHVWSMLSSLLSLEKVGEIIQLLTFYSAK